MRCYVYFCKYTSLLAGGGSTHKTSAIFESARRLPEIIQFPFVDRSGTDVESDYKFKPKSSDARPMCAKADRVPFVHYTVTLQNAVRTSLFEL